MTTSIISSRTLCGQVGEIAGVAEHGFFHERVAGTDRDAVAAGDAGGAVDLVCVVGVGAVPEHARMVALPVDGEGFVDLYVLAGLDTAAAEDALVGVVAVEGVGVVLGVGFGGVGADLVFYVENGSGVVDGAVLVVVVADRTVEHVVLEDAVEGLALGHVGEIAGGDDVHAGSNLGSAGARQLAIHLDHAGIATFYRAHLREVADLWERFLLPALAGVVDDVDEQVAGACGDDETIQGNLGVRGTVARSIEQRTWDSHIGLMLRGSGALLSGVVDVKVRPRWTEAIQ